MSTKDYGYSDENYFSKQETQSLYKIGLVMEMAEWRVLVTNLNISKGAIGLGVVDPR